MTFANNTPPANNNQRPKPIDRRFDGPDAFEAAFESAVRKAIGNSATTAGADPIRAMVMNALEVASIPTAGKTDSQMLADYTELLRQGGQAPQATAANGQGSEFAGYDLNQPTVNAAAAPVAAGNNKQAAGGDFAGYDLNNPVVVLNAR